MKAIELLDAYYTDHFYLDSFRDREGLHEERHTLKKRPDGKFDYRKEYIFNSNGYPQTTEQVLVVNKIDEKEKTIILAPEGAKKGKSAIGVVLSLVSGEVQSRNIDV